MNMYARFDENPAMTLQDIKETKRYGRTDGRTHARTHGSICLAYMNMFARFDENPAMIKPYIKTHLELQREVTLLELAPSPYFFV